MIFIHSDRLADGCTEKKYRNIGIFVVSTMTAADSATAAPSSTDSSNGLQSLIIPITSSASSDKFIEIFPEELLDISSSTLATVLKDEASELHHWADAALLYIQQGRSRESSALLQTACDLPWGNNRQARVRLLASAGIAHLDSVSNTNKEQSEELRGMADQRFTQSTKIDTLFPMQWIGRGMLNLSIGRMDQARFFFETTLKQCGQVLPALLGMAAVSFGEEQYAQAQDYYGKTIKLFPTKSGAPSRVGFGLASYKLGQVDRAKAAFRRALEMDSNNVHAMVGSAILDLQGLDEYSSGTDFRRQTEKAIKLMSMANLLDHSNAMVQNHLANHYFWKWTPVVGTTVSATKGSFQLTSAQPVSVLVGERIRVGASFETYVQDTLENQDDGMTIVTMRHAWNQPSQSSLKIWKNDHDRVMGLAKGAYNSTTVSEMQAESLFHLARVYHVREDFENALKFYERACKLAPNLSPARFGLAQALIMEKEDFDSAAAHLRLVLGTLSTATDALAALGLLEARGGKEQGLQYLKKAIALDPLNPNLYQLEALALQQSPRNYATSLQRYEKAMELMEKQEKKKVPYHVLVNSGVLCHELKKFEKANEYYTRALQALDNEEDKDEGKTNNETTPSLEGSTTIRQEANNMFYNYVDTKLQGKVLETDTKRLKITGDGEVSLLVNGDHVRLGDAFETQIVEIDNGEDGTVIEIMDEFATPDKDKENSQQEEKNDDEPKTVSVFVKRDNHDRLANPSAVSIAFNMARLHEAAGRIMAAVELHKAIVKRNPSYVNSYLRLACIARDTGALKECSEWLKLSHLASPNNPEVLTLMGNLHLSLCDWAPAQSLFDQLLALKIPNVEAYAMLSLGTIYFSNLKTPKKYSKHLQYAADYYKRILTKDKANVYAANGLGTVLAEKGMLFQAKEIFNRVREVSGDSIADAHLNLGHVYLAQRKHPEALQMYQSYMKRAQDSSTPITSKSRDDDIIQVLLYIAFCYFDWAREAEAYNDTRSAPADGRYKQCMKHLEMAMEKSPKENLLLTYNYCMAKLQAANCVLNKLTRNIRRTAAEVEEALVGLEESLPKVQTILQWKLQGKKVMIGTSMLQDFVSHCKQNMESAKSHLEEERKREEEANELREMQRLEAEHQKKEREYQLLKEQEEKAKKQEEQEQKARAKMIQVEQLRSGWELEAEMKKAAAEKKKKGKENPAAPELEEEPHDLFESEVAPETDTAAALFEDSDDDEEDQEKESSNNNEEVQEAPAATEKDLFGDSSSDEEESDEELVPTGGTKRTNVDETGGGDTSNKEGQPAPKKRRVLDDDE